MMAHRKRK
jgi:hypothetical protein